MTELKKSKFRILGNVVSCVLYISALSIVLVLISIVEGLIFRKSSVRLGNPEYWIRQFQNNIYYLIFFITCQFIAASLIIKNLSLKKLFALTFVCIVINHRLEASISNPVLYLNFLTAAKTDMK